MDEINRLESEIESKQELGMHEKLKLVKYYQAYILRK